MKSNESHINNFAYEGFEVFGSNNLIEKYRKSKISSVQKNINRIKSLFDKKITVLEVGSGNSKLLYALQQHDMLKEGYGVEISKTRIDFANKWKSDLNLSNVTNIHTNFFDHDLELIPGIDLIYGSDLVFQFFDPVTKGNDRRFLQKAYKKLKPGGKILLELDDHDRLLTAMKNNRVKVWQELEESDPWRYLLWDCDYDQNNTWITLNKIFIKRETSEVYKSAVILKNYSRTNAARLLKEQNFVNIKLFECWNAEGDIETDEFIIIGEKSD